MNAEYTCLAHAPGMNRPRELTGMVATKQRRNRSTGMLTPMAEAMGSMSRSMAEPEIE